MFTLDMRTGSALQSCVESLQAANMSIQLMKEGFGMLTHTYGSGSDTPDVDHQSMAERALIGQTVALAGADILGGVGQLECATVFSPVQAVMDNEIGAMMRRFIRKPSLEPADLNWEEMMRIRQGGHFLDSPHTIATCRDQLSPKIFLRQGRDDYEKSGAAPPSMPRARRHLPRSRRRRRRVFSARTSSARSLRLPPMPTNISSRPTQARSR